MHGISQKWILYEDKFPQLTQDEIVEKISESESLSPLSIISTAKSSTNKKVRKKAHEASGIYYNNKYKIPERWLKAKRENPIINPYEITKEIEKIILKSTRSICWIAKKSNNQIVRKEANIALKIYYDLERYHITENWEKLITEKPHLDSFSIIRDLEIILFMAK